MNPSFELQPKRWPGPPFCTRLKLARVASGVSQLRLAYETGLAPSVLSRFERGWRRPSPEVLAKIAAVLGVDSAELTEEEAQDA